LEAGKRGPFTDEQISTIAALLELTDEEESRLRLDAKISQPTRKVNTAVGRERLLVLDSYLEKMDILTDDQIALIGAVISMRMNAPMPRRLAIGDRVSDD
jgi:hypothetical protein